MLTQKQFTELKQTVLKFEPCPHWVEALKIEDVEDFMMVYGDSCWRSLYGFRPSLLLEHLNTYSVEVQLAAVKQDGYIIKFIKNPSPEVQLEAVKQNSCAIQRINNPGLEVQLAAVRNYGCSIYYIDNPSPEVQLEAVKQSRQAIRHIKNPSPEVLEYVNNCNKT
jgi:hypothetical protein